MDYSSDADDVEFLCYIPSAHQSHVPTSDFEEANSRNSQSGEALSNKRFKASERNAANASSECASASASLHDQVVRAGSSLVASSSAASSVGAVSRQLSFEYGPKRRNSGVIPPINNSGNSLRATTTTTIAATTTAITGGIRKGSKVTPWSNFCNSTLSSVDKSFILYENLLVLSRGLKKWFQELIAPIPEYPTVDDCVCLCDYSEWLVTSGFLDKAVAFVRAVKRAVDGRLKELGADGPNFSGHVLSAWSKVPDMVEIHVRSCVLDKYHTPLADGVISNYPFS